MFWPAAQVAVLEIREKLAIDFGYLGDFAQSELTTLAGASQV